ncbi:hypothetical protein EON65_15455 [archaeon]|nr:MAG: hypothetical protein EON65_15455 [archaeon]
MLSKEDCWRIIRIPASTSLPVLHAQLLCIAMGCCRDYHSYVFEVSRTTQFVDQLLTLATLT